MSRPHGRWLPLSLPRRLVADALRACRHVPTVTAERRMDLGELADARRAWSPRPAWSAIHAKAFALVAAAAPALRRSFVRLPWPHLYEHPGPVATVVVERDYRGEEAVFFAQLRRPHERPLAELDAWLRHCQTAPLAEVASFRRALRLARLPWPLRPAALWLGLHASGRLRERSFGTFSLSSPAAQGAGLLHLITALTATLHYGLFDPAGRLDMRLTFDHRVLDGATAARALAAMEAALRGPLLAELRRPTSIADCGSGRQSAIRNPQSAIRQPREAMLTPPAGTEDRAGFLHDPIGYMVRVYRRHGRAVTPAPGRDDFVFAFGPEHNKAILLQPDRFAATGFLFPGPKNSAQRRLLAGLFNLNGERHLDHRRVLWPTFRRLTALGYRDAAAAAEEFLSAWRFGEVRDVSAEMLALVARLNGRLLLGVAADDLVRQLEAATEEWMALNTPLTVAASLSLDLPRSWYEQALTCSERVETLTKQLLEIRQAGPAGGSDLLAQLLRAHARAPARVTAAEVVGEAAHIFAASNQSTRSALIWALFLLTQHPGVTTDLYAELRGELHGDAPTLGQMERLPLLERVIKEALRLFPPVAYYTRATAGPVELGGRRLRGGTTVVFSHYVTHHMPDLFPAPERFDPDRWHTAAPTPYEYLPYGIGPRMCIGVTYASLVLRVVLPLVVQRFRLTVAPGARVDRRVTTILSPRHPVPMRIDRPGPPFVAVPVAGDVHEMVDLPAAAAAKAA